MNSLEVNGRGFNDDQRSPNHVKQRKGVSVVVVYLKNLLPTIVLNGEDYVARLVLPSHSQRSWLK